jgi:hypothetical protein
MTTRQIMFKNFKATQGVIKMYSLAKLITLESMV